MLGTSGARRGRLLVATPPLVDPNFDRTVVLLLEHGDEGSVGVVLNRPTEARVEDVLPEWRVLASPPAVLFVGGPVSPAGLIALARGGGPTVEGWIPVLGGIGTVDLGRDPLDLGVPIDDLRVFAGYAGWGPGQLDAELAQHAWFVVDALPSDPFGPDPDRLWQDVLRRQRGRVAMFAHFPDDPAAN